MVLPVVILPAVEQVVVQPVSSAGVFANLMKIKVLHWAWIVYPMLYARNERVEYNGFT